MESIKSTSTVKKSNKQVLRKRWIGLTCLTVGVAWSLGLFDNITSSRSTLFGAEEQRYMRAASRKLSYNLTVGLPLPNWTDHLIDITEPINPSTQVNIFWYIPKSGGTTLEKVFIWCMGLALATDQGEADITTPDPITINEHVYNTSDMLGPFMPQYANVHTNSEAWIDELANRNYINAVAPNKPDLLFTQHFTYAIEKLLKGTGKKARASVMFRHPVKRIVDEFYYRQHATWEESYDVEQSSMSLEAYSVSDKLIENYYVRSLLQLKDHVEITKAHVDVAKEIIRRKMVVTVFEWYEVSVVRLEKFYGWWAQRDVMNNITLNHCHYKIIENSDHAGNGPRVPSKEAIYTRILIRNWADMELYFYAKNMFPDQRVVAGDGLFGA